MFRVDAVSGIEEERVDRKSCLEGLVEEPGCNERPYRRGRTRNVCSNTELGRPVEPARQGN